VPSRWQFAPGVKDPEEIKVLVGFASRVVGQARSWLCHLMCGGGCAPP